MRHGAHHYQFSVQIPFAFCLKYNLSEIIRVSRIAFVFKESFRNSRKRLTV